MWIVLLAHLRQENGVEARTAWEHARRARELFSPGIDMSFMSTFQEELASLEPADAGVAALREEIDQDIHSPADAPQVD
jgi:hypothetical protein